MGFHWKCKGPGLSGRGKREWGGRWAREIVRQRGKWTKEKKETGRQSSKKKKNETQPSHVFVKSLGLMQTVLSLIFFVLHRKAVQMFLRAALWFPCFPFASLFPALQRCQGAPLLGAGVFVFPESGAPTGGSSPGQLQMRNSWPAALAAAQIRPFEKITVLLLPLPPVGHARSAEGRGMCRRAGGGREHWGATFHSTSFRKFFSLLFFSLSSSNVSISAAQNRLWTVPK